MSGKWWSIVLCCLLLSLGAKALTYPVVGNETLNATLTVDDVGLQSWLFSVEASRPVNLSVCVSHDGIAEYCARYRNFNLTPSYMIGSLVENVSYDFVVVVMDEEGHSLQLLPVAPTPESLRFETVVFVSAITILAAIALPRGVPRAVIVGFMALLLIVLLAPLLI